MAKIDILGVMHDYDMVPAKNESDITLVFIHGWLLSRRYWQPIIDQVCDRFTCLSYDLRGFGASDTLSNNNADFRWQELLNPSQVDLAVSRCRISNYSPAAYARDLLMLLHQLNIKRPWLVGHSLGGTIGVWAAAMSRLTPPDSLDRSGVEGLICLNSGGGIYVQDEFQKFRSAGQTILKFRPPGLNLIPGLDRIFCRMNVASAVDRHWGQQLLQDFLKANFEAGCRALLDSTTPEEVLYLPQLVQGLQKPVYFIAGQQDQVMAPTYVAHLASFHPLFNELAETNLFELPNCGHLSMIEQPDQVAQLIQHILTRSDLTRKSLNQT